MSDPRLLAAVLALAACNTPSATNEVTSTPAASKPTPTDDTPIDPYARIPGGPISRVLAINNDPRRAPASTERPGSGDDIDIPERQRTANGFEIWFPTRSPIPTPTVHDGRLVVSGGFNSREIYAFASTTGRGLWGKTLSDDGPSTAICQGELCVFNSESCTTFAVDARTGAVRWAWWLGDPQTSAPTIAGGLAFASYPVPYEAPPGATHALAAFDLATGKSVWTRWLDGDVMSAPVAAGEFLYVTTFAGTVLKLEQQTGEIRYAVAMKATSAPVVIPGRNGHESMFVTRRAEERPEETKEAIVRAEPGDTRLTYRVHAKPAPYLDDQIQRATQYAKDGHGDDSQNGFEITPPAAGADVAKHVIGVNSISTMQRFQGSRVLVAGDLVISTLGDEVVAIDAETGASKWRHALPGNTRAAGGHLGTAPLLAGTDIVIATVGGDVIRLAARTGQVTATYRTHAQLRSQPVVVDGWIYLGTEDGRLIAIDTRDRALTGWPAWGGDAGRTSVRTL